MKLEFNEAERTLLIEVRDGNRISSIIVEITENGIPYIRAGPNSNEAAAVEIEEEIANTQNITVITATGERLDFVEDYL